MEASKQAARRQNAAGRTVGAPTMSLGSSLINMIRTLIVKMAANATLETERTLTKPEAPMN
jgi:hypothetical protein